VLNFNNLTRILPVILMVTKFYSATSDSGNLTLWCV
jgi:hypothetical protein